MAKWTSQASVATARLAGAGAVDTAPCGRCGVAAADEDGVASPATAAVIGGCLTAASRTAAANSEAAARIDCARCLPPAAPVAALALSTSPCNAAIAGSSGVEGVVEVDGARLRAAAAAASTGNWGSSAATSSASALGASSACASGGESAAASAVQSSLDTTAALAAAVASEALRELRALESRSAGAGEGGAGAGSRCFRMGLRERARRAAEPGPTGSLGRRGDSCSLSSKRTRRGSAKPVCRGGEGPLLHDVSSLPPGRAPPPGICGAGLRRRGAAPFVAAKEPRPAAFAASPPLPPWAELLAADASSAERDVLAAAAPAAGGGASTPTL
mmetsp:Transcript_110895/g.247600  ORF Transcript_110895/g.247600 Transcript_110895/m.247600 type:complete len:331 (+) Transcript_110895:47-1039(+)